MLVLSVQLFYFFYFGGTGYVFIVSCLELQMLKTHTHPDEELKMEHKWNSCIFIFFHCAKRCPNNNIQEEKKTKEMPTLKKTPVSLISNFWGSLVFLYRLHMF